MKDNLLNEKNTSNSVEGTNCGNVFCCPNCKEKFDEGKNTCSKCGAKPNEAEETLKAEKKYDGNNSNDGSLKQPTNKQKKGKNKNIKPRKWYTALGGVILSIMFVIVLLWAGFRFFFIGTPVIGLSMYPTLNAGEIVFDGNDNYYETSPYRDRLYISRFGGFGSGDIVVALSNKKYVVKRAIATEGQVIKLVKNSENNLYYFYLDGALLQEEYISTSRNKMDENYFARFTSIEGYNFATQTLTIPKGYCFLLGDNRGNSYDSMYYGPLSNSSVVGKVAFNVAYNSNAVEYLWNSFWGLFK